MVKPEIRIQRRQVGLTHSIIPLCMSIPSYCSGLGSWTSNWRATRPQPHPKSKTSDTVPDQQREGTRTLPWQVEKIIVMTDQPAKLRCGQGGSIWSSARCATMSPAAHPGNVYHGGCIIADRFRRFEHRRGFREGRFRWKKGVRTL